MTTTITLSSKGQLALPKKIRQTDELSRGDVFRLERQGQGKYSLERLTKPKPPVAKLVKSKDGFLVFRAPAGSPRITQALVKKLESETI